MKIIRKDTENYTVSNVVEAKELKSLIEILYWIDPDISAKNRRVTLEVTFEEEQTFREVYKDLIRKQAKTQERFSQRNVPPESINGIYIPGVANVILHRVLDKEAPHLK